MFVAGAVLTSNIAVASIPDLSLSALKPLKAELHYAKAENRVASYLLYSHYKQIDLNDNFSTKLFDRYLDLLDFNHNILTQSDLAALKNKWANKLDDQIINGQTQAAYEIYNLVMRLRYQRYAYALTVLEKPLDLTGNETFILDRTKKAWPKTQAELNKLWQARVKYDALTLILDNKSEKEVKDLLTKRYNRAIKRLTMMNSEDVFSTFMMAFTQKVDPHTSYLSPRRAEQFQTSMNLSLEGIGAVLQMEEDYTVVNSLVNGGPAAKSKQIHKGDRIVGVGQSKDKIKDVVGWRLDDIVEMIKGAKGSKVWLKILPEGNATSSYIVPLVREKVRLEDSAVSSKVMLIDGKKVGILTVPSFYVGLSSDTKKQLQKLEDQKITSLLVDLRNNGGGALDEAINLTGLFIDKGPVVQVRDSQGRVTIDNDNDGAIYYNGPMTVLINRLSASASEIFAAAMQDYGRAIILGEQSYGKGTVQQFISLNRIYDILDSPLGFLTYTIQKFYRINGGSTQNKGVMPDIIFPSIIDPTVIGENVNENALPWDEIKPAEYKQSIKLKNSIEKLRADHLARIGKNLEYKFINQDIEKYKKLKAKNSISLNLKQRKIEDKEAKEERLTRINKRRALVNEKPYLKLKDIPKSYEAPDAELKEAASITAGLENFN